MSYRLDLQRWTNIKHGRHFSLQCLLPDLVEKGFSIIIIQYEVKHYDRVLNLKIFPVY